MRKSKVVSISLPQEMDKQIKSLMKQTRQSRSEVIKNIVHQHLTKNRESVNFSKKTDYPSVSISQVLKLYHEITNKQSRKVVVVALAIIEKEGKILIGKRGTQDPYVKHLTWVFPGGQVFRFRFAEELKGIVKAETGISIKLGKLIHSRVHPDNLSSEVDIVALYFQAQVVEGKENPGAYKQEVPLTKLKWVDPTQVSFYFTTSVADEVMRFLKLIEIGTHQVI
jgi:ADP-ribose pyrophosphatase YjhB (NUDIX family)